MEEEVDYQTNANSDHNSAKPEISIHQETKEIQSSRERVLQWMGILLVHVLQGTNLFELFLWTQIGM
jgi:hypothetical protein